MSEFKQIPRALLTEAVAMILEYGEMQHDARTTCVEQDSRESAAQCMIEKRKALKLARKLLDVRDA